MWVFRYTTFVSGLLALGVLLGAIFYHFDSWHQPKPKPSADQNIIQPHPISCFVSDLDCADLEQVYFRDQFYGYGVKTGNGNLLSPFTGSLTTGSIRFNDELGGQLYHALTFRSNTDPNTSITYYLASPIDIMPMSVTMGQVLGAVPTTNAMPPLGNYHVVIIAQNKNNAIDPKNFLQL